MLCFKPVVDEFREELLQIEARHRKRMFHSNASNVVEDGCQFVGSSSFQDCQLVVGMSVARHHCHCVSVVRLGLLDVLAVPSFNKQRKNVTSGQNNLSVREFVARLTDVTQVHEAILTNVEARPLLRQFHTRAPFRGRLYTIIEPRKSKDIPNH